MNENLKNKKKSNSECYTQFSESYRIYWYIGSLAFISLSIEHQDSTFKLATTTSGDGGFYIRLRNITIVG
jgi:hypothetical protein